MTARPDRQAARDAAQQAYADMFAATERLHAAHVRVVEEVDTQLARPDDARTWQWVAEARVHVTDAETAARAATAEWERAASDYIAATTHTGCVRAEFHPPATVETEPR